MSVYTWLNRRHNEKFLTRLEKSISEPSGEHRTMEEMEADWEAERIRFDALPRPVKAARRAKAALFGAEGLLSVRLRPRYLVNHLVWDRQRARRGWADCDTWEVDGYITRVLAGMLDHLADHGVSYPSCPPFETPEKWSDHLRDLASRLRPQDDDVSSETVKTAMQEFAGRLGWHWD